MLQRITQDMLLFVTINTYEDEHKRILEFFSIWVWAFRATQLGEDDDKIESENIKAFVANLLAGELKQHLVFEEIPKDWDTTGVTVLVSKNCLVVLVSINLFY